MINNYIPARNVELEEYEEIAKYYRTHKTFEGFDFKESHLENRYLIILAGLPEYPNSLGDRSMQYRSLVSEANGERSPIKWKLPLAKDGLLDTREDYRASRTKKGSELVAALDEFERSQD